MLLSLQYLSQSSIMIRSSRYLEYIPMLDQINNKKEKQESILAYTRIY